MPDLETQPGSSSKSGVAPESQLFRSSAGLEYVLGAAFFFAVLFAVNAIVGSVWLARHNLWLDALIFVLLFAVGLWLVFFAGAFLFSATSTEARLGPDRVELLIPNWRGPTPYFPYIRAAIPYGDIAAIETRSEIYYYYILPVVVRGLTLVRKDGRRLKIGYTRENASENAFDYDVLADELSRRTGLSINYRGTVKAGLRLRALLHDEPHDSAPPLAEAEIARLRGAEGKAWKAAIAASVIIIAVGLTFQGVRIVARTFAGHAQAASAHNSNR